ncbi:MAG: cyanophycin synthetase, partial [Peptoniphilus harei]|nr:cyanophycin synthetase [Peptoniphilus harei]
FYKGAKVMDDYAHHPTEIKSSIHAIKNACKGKLYTVFQPHTFTRTKLLLDAFANSFDESDVIIITDIYAAREKDYGDIHSKTLRNAIADHRDNAFYISGFEDIVKFVKENISKDDIFVTMGAGDVYKIGEMLLAEDDNK